MKRVTLLILILAVLSVFSSPLHASSPVITDGVFSISTLFSKYFPFFVRTLTEVDHTPVLPSEDVDVPLVGGDPDDYANGRIGPGDDGTIDIFGPVITEKNVSK